MNRITRVTRFHLVKRLEFFVVPLSILLLVLAVSIIVALAIQRTGADTSSPDYIAGAKQNMAIIWSMPGFLIYYGVQAVATSYPLALSLGTTRRNFILGTFIANAIQSAFVAILLVAMLGLELVTNHWFMSVYVLDTFLMGDGNPITLFITAFIGVLVCLTLGGFFGAVWVRFGPKGPMVVGLALGLLLALTVLIIAPRIGEVFAAITSAKMTIAAAVVLVLALGGTWFAMRRASVR
ncbi:magnesium-transporting ATPase (P-type) [Leucobacter exalbidus]|uniref:Magnesium-transporting ATPase (P-type) n=1 Tax=Leucobacter exalbidus TaxID=662960 RepID=A0A940PTN0_9MICO|nr:hypothetical protein [Leucobacter exalbidus]MBP1326682.1 magnesium-transporting ATPase (P-type) [Leucobacter exalbidus]